MLLLQGPCFENHCPNYFSEMVRTCDSVAIGPFIYLLINCLLSVWKPGVCPFPLGPGSPAPALASFQIKPLSDGLSLHRGLSEKSRKGLDGKVFTAWALEPHQHFLPPRPPPCPSLRVEATSQQREKRGKDFTSCMLLLPLRGSNGGLPKRSLPCT